MSRGLFGWFIFIVFIVAAFVLIRARHPIPAHVANGTETPDDPRVTIVFILLGVSVLWLVLTYVIMVRWRATNKAERPSRQFQLTWSSAGLCFATGLESTTMAWSGFLSFVETPELFLFERPGTLWQIVPKRAFVDPQELQQFRMFAAGNLPVRAVPV
jgi:hypothetical protein